MSVSWEDSSSPARLKAHAAAKAAGEFDPGSPTWQIYADLRESLIMALLITGFPAKSAWQITESNWKQVYVRLQLLETVQGCFRIYNNANGAPRKMWFSPQEVRSMVGLKVNAGNISEAAFNGKIVRMLREEADHQVNMCVEPHKRLRDDPYYYEKLHRPTSRPVCNNLTDWVHPEETQDEIHRRENAVLDSQ